MATQPAFEAEEPAGNILQRLGLLRSRFPQQSEHADGDPKAGAKVDPRARRRLLNDIRAFLIDNDLEVTPFNLQAAQEACSGLNPSLSRQIAARKECGEPITQSWLEEATADDPCTSGRSIEDLAKKLERGIDELTRATKSIRRTTSEYGNELERRVDCLEASNGTEELIASLADFAKAMIARSRQTEEELRAKEAETARLRKNLDRARKDAEVDFLTGLPNRRAFEEALRNHHAEALSADEPLSVAFCDIDHFKAINDTHGHDAGDRILKEVAETLSNMGDRDCYLARHGGEEFVTLFRGMEPDAAFEMLDGAREELAQRNMINRKTQQPFGIVTFSGGVADVRRFKHPRDALAAADQALYCAKKEGRNQIRLA